MNSPETRFVTIEPIPITMAQSACHRNSATAAGMAISFNGSLMMRLIMLGTSCINSLCKIQGRNLSVFCSGWTAVILSTWSIGSQRYGLKLDFCGQMKISSARMISSALSLMLFILPTHSIWSCAFILSFTPSLRCI